MNYIAAMQRLAQYRKDLRESNMWTQAPYNLINGLRQNRDRSHGLSVSNLKAALQSELSKNRLSSVYELFGPECAQWLERETADYENRLRQIQASAQQELDKLNKKTPSIAKTYLGIVLGFASVAMICAGAALSMTGGLLAGLAVGVVLLVLMTKKSKPDEAVLASLVSETKQLMVQYASHALSVLEPAYNAMEANRLASLDMYVQDVKAFVGERIFFLFENTPYMQQEYFIQLGMTATCEEEFGIIAQECLKADKSEQLVNLQNMVARESQEAIVNSMNQLNRTARQMHEDAEFRARQQADYNAQIVKQNQRNLANQARANEELRKARREADDREYRIRHL